MTTSLSPARIDCAAKATVLSPDPHTLFTVKAGTSFGIPDLIAIWRATFCPNPALRTFPKITSLIS